MQAPLWVADLLISDRTAQKIRALHGIEPDEVRDRVVCRSGLDYEWVDEPPRARRAIVRDLIRGEPVLIVLYPVTGWAVDDVYHLGSAYHLHRRG